MANNDKENKDGVKTDLENGGADENTQQPTTNKGRNAGKRTQEVDVEMLQELIAQNKDLSKTVKEQGKMISELQEVEKKPKTLREVKERDIRLRAYEDTYIIGKKDISKNPSIPQYIWSEFDKDRREEVAYMSLIAYGRKDPIKMAVLEYVRLPQVKFRATDIKVEEVEYEQGTVAKKVADDEGITRETGYEADLVVKNDKYRTFTIEINGEKVQIKEDDANN